MKKLMTILVLHFILITPVIGQYDNIFISGGANFSNYLGKGQGEGDNYFKTNKPGFQIEISGYDQGFEWVFWGIAYYGTSNFVGENEVPVKFWIPYYTEVIFYQMNKENPFFGFLGYDYVRMRFPNMKKPDNHHNITFGGGWNFKLLTNVYMQFKVKPYFIIGNSIGQTFGINFIVNLRLRTK